MVDIQCANFFFFGLPRACGTLVSHRGSKPPHRPLVEAWSPNHFTSRERAGSQWVSGAPYKKRWQEYTEELYRKDLHDQDNHDGVITDLEPDILECEVKWALESITTNKASWGDGIPVELFQILKDDAVKMLHSICQQLWKTQQWPQDWKRSVFIPIPKKGNAKNVQPTTQLHSSHTIAK